MRHHFRLCIGHKLAADATGDHLADSHFGCHLKPSPDVLTMAAPQMLTKVFQIAEDQMMTAWTGVPKGDLGADSRVGSITLCGSIFDFLCRVTAVPILQFGPDIS